MPKPDYEAIADRLSENPPACYSMLGREKYRDCVKLMLDDLFRLSQEDGCVAAAWALTLAQQSAGQQ